MALAIDSEMASATGFYLASASPSTYSFTNDAGTYLLVWVNSETTTGEVTGVTYGGETMTLVDSNRTHNGTGGYHYCYELLDPPTGANDISITYTGGAAHLGGAISFTGHAASPRVQVWKANDVSYENPIALSCTGSTAGNLIVAGACCGAGITDPTVNTLTYKRNVDAATHARNCIGLWDEAGGTVTMGTAYSGSDGWAIIAVEVGAAGGTPPAHFWSRW